jgi:succinate-acetate transporter protein
MNDLLNNSSGVRFWISLILVLSQVQASRQPDFSPSGTKFLIEIIIVVFAIVTFCARANTVGKSKVFGLLMLVPLVNFYALYVLGIATPKKDK